MKFRLLLCALICGCIPAGLFAQSKVDPADWILWRAAPIAFPDSISPQVPELLQGEKPVDFGPEGSDLTIVMPDGLSDDYASKALDWTRRFILDKAPKARFGPASALSAGDLNRHLILLGTPANNPMFRRVLGGEAPGFLQGITPGGYRIKTAAHPDHPGKRVILALGVDMAGAYSAGAVLCHAIHPDKEGVNLLGQWPVAIPAGCYWIPFEARASPPIGGYEKTRLPDPPPPRPRVPFAVRIWGSPMTDLPSYQRLVRALKPTGMNAIVVQSGGWIDLPDAVSIFKIALDIAWQEGIYTCLYVGNEEAAHKSAPLTPNHKAVIQAVKDHPGLLAFHLYNQLGLGDSPGQFKDLEQQVRWINSITDRPTSIEIVWGHNSVEIPAEKQQLMRQVKSWGLDVIGTDYAPIGGWSEKPDLSRWEKKMLAIRPFEDKVEVLIQAHVPFLGATVPTAAQVRNQFWWALAGGVHGYFVEVSYLFTHLNMRGLLSWDLRPLPDGRFQAVAGIAADSQKMAEFITETKILSDEEAAALGIHFTQPSKRLHLRLRAKSDGSLFVLVINEDLEKPASAKLALDGAAAYHAVDVLTGGERGRFDSRRPLPLTAQPGGAVCFKLTPMR